jgi:hypothetical protein
LTKEQRVYTLEGQKASDEKHFCSVLYSTIYSPNTSFFTTLTPGRPGFRLVLVQVDQNVGMVDQDKGDSRPLSLPESLKLAYSFYCINDCHCW